MIGDRRESLLRRTSNRLPGAMEAQKSAFDEFTAMRVEVAGYDGEEENEVYEFKINMDNTPLLNEIKQRRLDDGPAKKPFSLRKRVRWSRCSSKTNSPGDRRRTGAETGQGTSYRDTHRVTVQGTGPVHARVDVPWPPRPVGRGRSKASKSATG